MAMHYRMKTISGGTLVLVSVFIVSVLLPVVFCIPKSLNPTGDDHGLSDSEVSSDLIIYRNNDKPSSSLSTHNESVTSNIWREVSQFFNATASLLKSRGEVKQSRSRNGNSDQEPEEYSFHTGTGDNATHTKAHDENLDEFEDELSDEDRKQLEELEKLELSDESGEDDAEGHLETLRISDILHTIFVDEFDDGLTVDDNGHNRLDSEEFMEVEDSSPIRNRSRHAREAESGRSSKDKKDKKREHAKQRSSDMAKYNAYMDAVLKRMNQMIKTKKMDPLRVNLYAGPNQKEKEKNKKKNKKKSRGEARGRFTGRMHTDSSPEEDSEEQIKSSEDTDEEMATRDVFLNDKKENRKMRALLENVTTDNGSGDESKRGFSVAPPQPESGRAKVSSKPKTKKSSASSDPKGSKGSKGSSSTSSEHAKHKGTKGAEKEKEKQKHKQQQEARPTRGILHGLSTLRRNGNVQVIREGEKGRLVRANFLLGPVALEIFPRKGGESSSGRSHRKGTKASADDKNPGATATAPQLKGRLEVRLRQGSPTRINRLVVHPPGNVKVAGDAVSKSTGRGYNRVTPVATARLRQIALQVVRQADSLRQ